jgi:FAD/FMN-containing dehydrogenase
LIAVAPVMSAASTRGAPPAAPRPLGGGTGLARGPAPAGTTLAISMHTITLAPVR